ncbi:MFS transporter [Alicyclobacillus macrosporangiidus]|jgi:metabolite-proton symporter|uniref:Metabolite-proton symporter n=1 Tax=Alicyclobacillus macrosporangiidus TaxID=392015 RepID=A0A1I7JAQ2_9BACL|nr:MFS transporter [Alicyclobacillus macrosporangiidus]SFU82222.1 metabolite-proton symporter [Alicyclobacillus macrosporangiidus]
MAQVQGAQAEIRQTQVRRAAIASTIGTAIEWYDYFLYGTAAALVFPKLFFPNSDPFIGQLQSFATMFLGFVARPVGAAIFGHYGDRLGRKATLIITLLLMGLSSAAMGILPTYAAIGVWAPVILIVLRILQGIGVGGEWGGSVLMSMEWGHHQRRGLMGSWPQLGVPLGLLFSSLFTSIFIAISGSAFNTWGWRIPFLLSLVMVLIGLFIRLRVMETPHFQEVVQRQKVVKVPVIEAIKSHPKEIILSALVRMAEQAPFYLFITFILSYGSTYMHYNKGFLTNATTVAAVLSLFTVPFAGYLSDRIGRRKMYAIGTVLVLLYAYPYFWMVNTGIAALAFIAIVISLIPHDFLYGPQAALIAENFPSHLRYSGASLGYQLASVIAGGPAPLIATWLMHKYGSSSAISAYIVFNAVVTLIALAFLKGRSEEEIVREYRSAESHLQA